MHISIVWHDRSFNINLHSSEGKDACKYWNHAYINSAFQAKVLELAKASQPVEQKTEPKKELKTFADIDDEIQF